ncbi:MFS transporter [Paracoccaceae bacterium Fryx2]|nr:MFS transporter [Paracoccaceae bacterium Fryx2]
MPDRVSPLAPFRHATFRNLWLATLASNLGGLIQTVGAGWLMTTLTTSPGMIALVQASTTLPLMLFSLPSGALADSFNRRKIMLTAQLFLLSVSAGLAACAYLGVLTPVLLLCFTFLIGVGGALNNPSWQASMGDIVPRDDLPSAVALNSMGFNLMRSVGPALGGAIVAWAGAAVAFAANAVSYIPFIWVLWRWKSAPVPRSLPREPFGSAMVAGLRYVAMSPQLLRVMTRGFLFGLAAIAVLALLPLVARDLVQGEALTYGVLLGCFGFGAIGGALLNPRIRERMGNEGIVRGAFLAFAVGATGLAFSGDLWLSGALLLPCGAAWVLALSLFNVSVQLSTPRWVVGRAMAMYQTATFGGMALGAAIWGQAAERFGVSVALMLSAAVMVLGAALGLRLALPAFATQNLDPLNRFREPAVRIDMRARSGPILVMVDYRIAQENVEPFLAAMADRRRIRIRDGARQWALLRDVETPEQWTESYHVATWAEYLRHHQRRTQADGGVTDRLLALHRGPEPPRVHRMIERQTVSLHDDTPLKPFPDVS